MKKLKIGIVGATGLVGKTLIQIFKEEQMLSKIDLFLICSEKSSGKRMIVNGNEMRLITLNEKCLSLGLDVVVFSAVM